MKITYPIAFLLSSTLYAYDLPKKSVKAYQCANCNELSHEQLQKQWPLEDNPLNNSALNIQESFSYEQKISAKELQDGVALSVQAPGAVILITPLQEKPLPEINLQLSTTPLTLKKASILQASNDALAEPLMAIPYQNMMQINPELGTGLFILKSKNPINQDQDSYLLHVFDKFSSTSLNIQADKLQYQYGEQLNANITLKNNKKKISTKDISAYLVSPSNQNTPLQVRQMNANEFQITTSLFSELNPQGGNWYIEVELWNHFLHRTVRTAFSYSIPSANVLSIKKIASQPLTFLATIEVASASRYALQSVLFHKNKSPLELSQSAQWLEPGVQTIAFIFNNAKNVSEDKLLLGYLHLIDYGQIKEVYQYNQQIKLNEL